MTKKKYDKILRDLNELLKSHEKAARWDHDAYTHGMYNGMEFVIACMQCREPQFKDAPKKYINNFAYKIKKFFKRLLKLDRPICVDQK